MRETFDSLVFGASGPVGQALAVRLQRGGEALALVSRQPRAGSARARWFQCDLYAEAGGELPSTGRVYSAGPLDGFVRWCRRRRLLPGTRIVALSSTSAVVKRDSPDAVERALAQTLLDSERTLLALGAERGCSVTLIRPTLIYGHGADRSLAQFVQIARRIGAVPLPARACGRRQPVHADDLAAAMQACAGRADLAGRILTLPGGETVAYREMVQRQLDASVPGRRVWPVPGALLKPLLAIASILSSRARRIAAQLARAERDVVFPCDDWRELQLTPRAFRPE